jgi:hypothetical protein
MVAARMMERSQLAAVSLPACTLEQSRQRFNVVSISIVIVLVGPPTKVRPGILDEFIASLDEQLVSLGHQGTTSG